MQLWFPTWEATMTPGSALEFLRSEVVKLRFAHVQAKSHITDARVDGTQFLSPDPPWSVTCAYSYGATPSGLIRNSVFL